MSKQDTGVDALRTAVQELDQSLDSVARQDVEGGWGATMTKCGLPFLDQFSGIVASQVAAAPDVPARPLLIVRYSESFGRMGALVDTFACTDLELRALKATGTCDRGEVLGKHSEVYSTLSDDTLTVLTEDAAFIAQAERYGLLSGNPFWEYLSETTNADNCATKYTGLTPDEVAELGQLWGFRTA